MINAVGGYQIFWLPEGMHLEYRDRILFIADLNPEIEIKWAITPGELFGIGCKCIIAAIRALKDKA